MREARVPFPVSARDTSRSSVTKGVIDDAAHDAATSPYNADRAPTRRQAHAGNYRKGRINIAGLRISIENPAGSHRRPEWPALASHYGYVRGSRGADGDHVDVFVRPGCSPDFKGSVYVVDQLTQEGDFDEHKAMLGWPTRETAEAAYLENYTPGWKVGPITEFSVDEFKEWLKGDTTGPIVKGDVSGHEFHGNQWTGGSGSKPKTTTGKPKKTDSLKTMSKAEADAKYKETMGHALTALAQNADHYGDDPSKMHSCLLDFKNAKAEAMAQWTKDTTGVKRVAAPQQVFNADKNMWGNLLIGVPKDEALKTWKYDTQNDKELAQASSAVDQALGGSTVELSDGTKYTGTGKGLEGIPKDVVPKGFETVSHDDFKGKVYANMNTDNRDALLVGSGTAERNKAEVCERLRAELADSANYQKMKEALGFGDKGGTGSLESKLVQSWANSSGDSNTLSVAMQMAVRDTFGMKDEDLSLTALNALHNAGSVDDLYHAAGEYLDRSYGNPPSSDVVREGMKEFIAGMYRSTQADLAARGITEFAVARGMTIGDNKGEGSLVNTSMQPASSFTTSMSTAVQFTDGVGTVYFARVPASQVLSTFRSGWGCTSELEVVVLSHTGMRMGRIGEGHQGLVSTSVGKTVAQLYRDMGMKGSGNVSLAGEGG